MSSVRIDPATGDELERLAAVAADAQRDPERFVAYFGETPESIAAEVAAFGDWAAASRVARRSGDVVGWLLAESDDELHRIWWWGPVVAPGEHWATVAEPLYVAARASIDPRFDGEELAVDAGSSAFAAFADRHGFHREEDSVVFRVETDDTVADPRVSPLTPADAGQVAALHDALFPGTHTTGRQLVERADATRLVVRDGARVVGYVATEVQPDGAGYIDFLGVDPGERGRGLGGALVATALDDFRRRGVTVAGLTMRVSNEGARRLYRRLGFEELRLLRPFRKGFRVGD